MRVSELAYALKPYVIGWLNEMGLGGSSGTSVVPRGLVPMALSTQDQGDLQRFLDTSNPSIDQIVAVIKTLCRQELTAGGEK